jgi:tetratricopeptide (TPR) repeat protein
MKALSAYLLLLALLSLFISFHPEWRVWGLDSLRVFPHFVRIGLVVLLAASLIPSLNRRLGTCLAESRLSARRLELSFLIIAIIFLGLSVLLSSRNHLLGDGYTLLQNIRAGYILSPTEPLSYLSRHLVYLIMPEGEIGALWAYRICSYIAGAGFLWVLYSTNEDKTLLVVGLPLVLTFPVIQFFFGYVESYVFSFLFALWYLLSARNDLAHHRLSWLTPVLLLLAIGFHFSGAALLPSIIYLIWNRFRSKRAASIALVTTAVIVVVGLIVVGRGIQFSQVFVPLMPTTDNPYSLLSAQHLSDLGSLLLLDYPLLPILLTALLLSRISHRWFYLLALIPALLYVVTVDPKIGALRDWDLLSRASAPTIVIGLELLRHWATSERRRTISLALPLLLFAFIHTGSWIMANTDRLETYEYVKNVVAHDVHYSGSYYKGYRNKGWSTLAMSGFKDVAESMRAEVVRLVAAPDDFINRYNLVMQMLFHTKQYHEAVKLLGIEWLKMTGDAQRTLNLAGLFRKVGDYKTESMVLRSFVDRGRPDRLVFYNYAHCLAALGQTEQADFFYKHALALWPDAPVDVRFEYCRFLLDYGTNSDAADCLSAIAPYFEPRLKSMVEALISALRADNEVAIQWLRSQLNSSINENPGT